MGREVADPSHPSHGWSEQVRVIVVVRDDSSQRRHPSRG
ncbi:hypothetical protein SLI_4730 [Streptomyces lividans 1326]|uniref:Uncharacterized protein n=1 Tax=Streptomyces lividans 1326 TaxID=1200984 RepID=A0A7U9HC89_STRLI|nr:hypothetical protein SLI_4730 [Streptomyces lividans 1326]